MTALLYIAASLLLLFGLSLTPPGTSFRRWMMAKAYNRAQRKFDAAKEEMRAAARLSPPGSDGRRRAEEILGKMRRREQREREQREKSGG